MNINRNRNIHINAVFRVVVLSISTVLKATTNATTLSINKTMILTVAATTVKITSTTTVARITK